MHPSLVLHTARFLRFDNSLNAFEELLLNNLPLVLALGRKGLRAGAPFAFG
jgi:hypothetical protein